MKKLRNVVAVLIGAVLVACSLCLLCACGKNDIDSDGGQETETSGELERVKRIVEKELSYLSPMYDDIEPLKYDSCTFTSVKENADGGHTLRGEVFFTDKHGVRYSQPYRAEIDKGSWAPRIVKFDIVKLN